jgi:hypothetical protein
MESATLSSRLSYLPRAPGAWFGESGRCCNCRQPPTTRWVRANGVRDRPQGCSGLINNIWSFAGDTRRPAVNQMQLQPEINYSFKHNPNGYLTFSPTIMANWQAGDNERWTVPVSLGIGQLVKFGSQAINLQATAYYNVVAPAGTGAWTLEMELQFLFPK